MTDRLGEALARLHATIEARKGGDPQTSYTAKLLSRGAKQCAKKFGEEAVEAALEAALGERKALAAEAADVLYHLFVMLAAAGVTPDEVADRLVEREGVSGVAEKASRKR